MASPALRLVADPLDAPAGAAPVAAAPPAPAPAPPALEGAALALAERLRGWGAEARRGRPGDLDRACAAIGAPGAALQAAQGAALLSALATGCTPALTLHRRGARAASRDELWLLALLDRLAAGDEASARFLVARRVRPVARRRALFLARRIAEGLAGAATGA